MSQIASVLSTVEPWDLVADGYADELSMLMEGFSRSAADIAVLRRDATVLDVGAGPGTLSLAVAERVAEVHAVDFSRRMLDRLAAAAHERKITNIVTHVGDGQALPFDTSRFDAAFSLFGLMFFPDRAKGFAELYRVLRTDGVAIVSSWAPVGDSSLMQLVLGALRAADPEFPPPRQGAVDLEIPEMLAHEMRAAKFDDVSVEPHEQTMALGDIQEFWERLTRSSAPLAMLRRRVGETEWRSRSVVACQYIERESAGRSTVSTKAWFGTGYKR